ncbi:MAG: nitroreductase family protein [Halothiobacillaceae bacterium]|nr:MAG: nitroreductase family protein [Halothiobacillaceae bacterium]
MNKRAETSVPVLAEIAERWSPRAFDASRMVEKDKLLAVLEAARWAPSSSNEQPWRYIVCDRANDAEGWQRAFDQLTEGNRLWCKDVPVLLVALADTLSGKGGEPHRWGAHDTGAASENLYLEAVRQGLAAHPMGGFDAEGVRKTFAVPERFLPIAMIALGYQGRAEQLDGWRREAEVGARQRRPLHETFFAGQFGMPWKAGA